MTKFSVYLYITEQHVITLWPHYSSSFPPLPTAVNASYELAGEARAETLYLEKYFTSKFRIKLNNQAF